MRNVSFNETQKTFNVVVEDLQRHERQDHVFDYVVVASGHFSTPHVPSFPGVRSFSGRVLHAHDFRDAKEFAGRNVLVVGSSYSAEDISLQLYKYGAKSITISYRSRPMAFSWPANMEERPIISNICNKDVTFADGVTKSFDAIILCTGYQHSFPFLPDSLRLKTANVLYPGNLYKGVAWVDNPRLLYLGMQDQFWT